MQRKKHIVFLMEHMSLGGAEVVLTEYLRSIDSEKYRVSLILRDDLGERNYLLKQVPSNVEVKTVFSPAQLEAFKPLPGKGIGIKWKNLQKKKANKAGIVSGYLKALEELSPVDVVIDFAPVLNRFLKYFRKYKMVLWMHGQKSHMPKWERLKYLWRMRRYDKIVLICEEMREQFIELFPSVQKKFDVIYNPFDFDRIKTMAEDDSELSERDRELIQGKYVLSLGRLVPGKDFPTIIEAARILKEKGFTYTHYIVGAGELHGYLQQKIDRYGLQNHMFLLGPRKNPYIWLKHSQLFVHSALREGLPTVIIEAMVLSKPIIACTCPTGPREILENGRSGSIYDVGDSQRLAQLIEQVLGSKELQEAQVHNANRRVEDFHRSKVMPKFYALIESLT